MQIPDLAREYAASTERFLDAVASVPVEALDRTPLAGWSPRMIVHHLADAETVAHGRLRRLLVETDAILQGFDEEAWADCAALGYRELPIEPALALFAAARASSLTIVERLEPADLTRTGEHTAAGPYSVERWITNHIGHANAHADQLERAVRGEA